MIALHLALEGDNTAQPPEEWLISRVCEEFNCPPSVAVNELMDDPSNMVIEIMGLRSYVRAKEAIDNAKNSDDIPDCVMTDKVFEVQSEIIKRKRRQ